MLHRLGNECFVSLVEYTVNLYMAKELKYPFHTAYILCFAGLHTFVCCKTSVSLV